MATKSGLTTAIATAISIVITRAKILLGLNELINELWQTTTTDTLTTGSNVFWRNLHFKKVGNIVYVDGYITNKYAVAKSSLSIVTIPNSVYNAKTGQDTLSFGMTDYNGTPVMISFSGTTIYLIGSLAPNQKIWINAHYQTND